MTSYVLGTGRLVFEPPLRRPDTDFGQARFRASGKTTPEVMLLLRLIYVCGYNPQRLLTDQRSSLRRFADGVTLGEPYMPGDEISLMRKREPTFATGGRIPHLFPGTKLEMLPAVLPRGEAILPNPPWDPFGTRTGRFRREPRMRTFSTPVNTSKVAELVRNRLRRAMNEPPVFAANLTFAAEGAARFSAALQKVQDQIQAYQERVMLFAIHAGYAEGPPFAREHRIARLLLSRDPRQRKRGNRLFHQWRKTRPGINFNRYRKD